MAWRIISGVIILFWAVMAGLIIRDAYFPEESRFAEVPPTWVMDRFLERQAAPTALHLLKDGRQIGHASFQIRKTEDGATYLLHSTGAVDAKASEMLENDVGWWLDCNLAKGMRLTQMNAKVRSGQRTGSVEWKDADAAPRVLVEEEDRPLFDSAASKSLPGFGGASAFGLFPGMLGSGANAQGAIMTAREGRIDIAGKRRRCHLLQVNLLGMYQIKAYFTEVGELARIDLPFGYTLLEATIHGMESGFEP